VPGWHEPALWGLVGNTPIISLERAKEPEAARPALLLKADWFNPGGSVKTVCTGWPQQSAPPPPTPQAFPTAIRGAASSAGRPR